VNMNTCREEITGREFDWFALDKEGNIALFSTVGSGTVPESVLLNYAEHDSISESLATPNWGSSQIWSDYADKGLFVYDWKSKGGVYNRQREPSAKINAALSARILAITSLPRYECAFRDLDVFQCVNLT